jgi:hypothetical protein
MVPVVLTELLSDPELDFEIRRGLAELPLIAARRKAPIRRAE